ncbi:hypothetical protein Tco_0576643 [Tanacetum coccineum]
MLINKFSSSLVDQKHSVFRDISGKYVRSGCTIALDVVPWETDGESVLREAYGTMIIIRHFMPTIADKTFPWRMNSKIMFPIRFMKLKSLGQGGLGLEVWMVMGKGECFLPSVSLFLELDSEVELLFWLLEFGSIVNGCYALHDDAYV